MTGEKTTYLGVEIIDRGRKADEACSQGFRKIYLSILVSVSESERQEEVVLKRDCPVFVGVKELKDLVNQFLKEGVGDAVEDVPVLRLLKNRSVLVFVKNFKSDPSPLASAAATTIFSRVPS